MSAHPFTWSDGEPTVDEAVAFADLGLPPYSYTACYARAAKVLAAEVKRLRSPTPETEGGQ